MWFSILYGLTGVGIIASLVWWDRRWSPLVEEVAEEDRVWAREPVHPQREPGEDLDEYEDDEPVQKYDKFPEPEKVKDH